MSSWYIEVLLRNRDIIRSSIYSTRYDKFGDEIVDVDIDDNDYNNLLLVENMLEKLYQYGQLSDKEATVVRNILLNKSLPEQEHESKIARVAISKIFSNVCSRVGFYLGYEFTDEGYIDYMVEKYELTNEQIETMRKFMASSQRRFKLRFGRSY